MKILVVSDTYEPDVNGVARTLRMLADGLCGRGHEVVIITAAEPGSTTAQPRRVTFSLPLPGYPAVRIGLASKSWLKEVLRHVDPDVIYVAVESLLGFAAIRAAHDMGVPVVSGFHTNFQHYVAWYRLALLRPLTERVLRYVHNRAQLTITPSREAERTLRRIGVRRLAVVGRGVDATLFHPAKASSALRQAWGAASDAPVALYVGRLAREKNLGLLQRAFAQVEAEVPRAKCVVVGDGPLLPTLRAAHPTWHFAGELHGDELATHYASADILVFPSLTETFGNVILEGMASGLVTVAYDTAAASEHLQHGANGLLAEPNDEAAFLSQVREATGRWSSAELRGQARRTAISLTWPEVCRTFEAHLARVVPTPCHSSLSPALTHAAANA